jgi:hypothetical protein
MHHIGIDLHKNSSQICILTQDGELIERRLKTDRQSLDKMFAVWRDGTEFDSRLLRPGGAPASARAAQARPKDGTPKTKSS